MRGLRNKLNGLVLLVIGAIWLFPAPEVAFAGNGEDDFADSAAYDSHSTADLEVIRAFEKNWSANATRGAEITPPQTLASPLKVTPPEGPHPTALRLFRLIPPTIFDNTVQGLSETDKQVLADNGRAADWVLNYLTNDDLEFTSTVPYSNTQVRVHLFYGGNGDIIVASGAQSGEGCAVELWRRDVYGRIIPVPIPDEPLLAEFLGPGRELPEGYEVSMLMCLDSNDLDSNIAGLKAVPLIWSATGLETLELDYDIYYLWNGEAFQKTAVRRGQ